MDGHAEDSVVESPLAGGAASGLEAIDKVYQGFTRFPTSCYKLTIS